MKMKLRMTNLLYVRLQERNRSKKDVIKPMMTKTLHLWCLRDLRNHTATGGKGTTCMAGTNCYTGTSCVKGLPRARRGDLDLGKNAEGEALRNIINTLFDERDLRDLHRNGFLIVLDGATSHLTAYPCKSTSPSEVGS